MRKLLFCLLFFFLFINLSAQQNYPTKYFRSPIEFRILLSGTFGELRSNHFHSGIDIKTDGIIGKNIYVIADGYVARISVSETGFGKALYIKHPNGYTSVYGHLSQFSDSINKYVRTQQYKREQFRIGLYPPAEMFVVKKGEIIAKSGNSGGSDGPHLHFEIRDSGTEIPINPLLFGYRVKDDIRPKITGFRLYPANEKSRINNKNQILDKKVKGSGLNNRLRKNDTIEVSGGIGFGIKTYDLLNDSYNRNGVYSIKLWIDTNLIYSHKVEKFSFSETKYINSLIDYAEYIENHQRYQRSIVDPGNKLSIYDGVIENGVYHFSDSSYHQFIYELKDVVGNTSKLTGVLKSMPFLDSIEEQVETGNNWFEFNSTNEFKTDSIELYFKKGSFYRSFNFNYELTESPVNSYSKLHKIHTHKFPLHKSFEIRILPEHLPDSLRDKAMIAKVVDEDLEAVGGAFKDGFVVGSASSFGDFTISLDTIQPEISALNIHNGKKITGYKYISFEIKDEFSGIRSYRATLNGEWILMEHDPKNDKLIYRIDDRMKKGKNQIRLEVKDVKDNLAVYEAEIEY